MNRALLDELQRQSAYPSITVLMNTTDGELFGPADLEKVRALAQRAIRRLDGDASNETCTAMESALEELIEQCDGELCGQAVALFASPDYRATVKLGRPVKERIIIDDTFATRDLVADLNRTAQYRVVTISDRKSRVLIGDRRRLVEERDAHWPLHRDDGQSATSWAHEVAQCVQLAHQRWPLPTVIAGVERTVRKTVLADNVDAIGFVAGNHDRTSWMDLHTAAWPLVADWLHRDGRVALERLEAARSAARYAGGIDEIWPLANEGRIELLVVEETYAVAARLADQHRLEPTDDIEAPDVVDDIVDDTIELVLRSGGTAVLVAEGELEEQQRIAAILRY